jgi:hypothetical protein
MGEISEICEFYCLSYKNEERRIAVQNSFNQLNLRVNFYDGVDETTDCRILEHEKCYKRCWSCMYGHLDMINKFYNETDKEFGIFCEDDIYLHKNLKHLLPEITKVFKEQILDVLLLGYLITYDVSRDIIAFPFLSQCGEFHNVYKYPDDVWGTQMYMISRSHAKTLLNKYYNGDYARASLEERSTQPFSSDWTITKDGNRALIYPMLAVEDGKSNHEHWGQHNFHQQAHLWNYNPEQFI